MTKSTELTGDISVPQYQRLKDHISRQIASGDLMPGQRVPSEAELGKNFSLSRMTVSRALNELASEGVISRVQGIGTFVSRSRSEATLLEIHSIADEIAREDMVHSCRVLFAKKTNKPRRRALLGLGEKDTYFRTILLHLADGFPFQIEDRCVNPKFAPNYLKQDFTKVTPHEHLMSLGPLQAAEHVFEARLPTAKMAGWLDIEQSTPCMALLRRTWSLNIVASFAVFTVPGNLRRYSGQFGDLPAHAARLPAL